MDEICRHKPDLPGLAGCCHRLAAGARLRRTDGWHVPSPVVSATVRERPDRTSVGGCLKLQPDEFRKLPPAYRR